jgi:carboxypeptidase D
LKFIDSGDPVHYNLAGVSLIDAVIGNNNVQMNIPIPSYAAHWDIVLGINDSFITDLAVRAEACGMTSFLEQYLQFPPPATPFTDLTIAWENATWAQATCNMYDSVYTAAKLVNPCFDSHHITDVCPVPL